MCALWRVLPAIPPALAPAGDGGRWRCGRWRQTECARSEVISMLGSRAVFISGTLKCVAKGNGVGMPKKGRLFEKSADASMVFVVLALAFAWSIDAGAPLEGYAPSIRFDYLLLGSCCALAALIPGAVRKMTSSVCPRGLVISGFAGVLLSVASTWGGAILAYAAALCTVVFQTVVLLGCFARLSRLKMTLVLLWLAFWLCATGLSSSLLPCCPLLSIK